MCIIRTGWMAEAKKFKFCSWKCSFNNKSLKVLINFLSISGKKMKYQQHMDYILLVSCDLFLYWTQFKFV